VCPAPYVGGGLQQEWTLGSNWFFNGHRNKLTADLSYLVDDLLSGDDEALRLRLQWDVSF